MERKAKLLKKKEEDKQREENLRKENEEKPLLPNHIMRLFWGSKLLNKLTGIEVLKWKELFKTLWRSKKFDEVI